MASLFSHVFVGSNIKTNVFQFLNIWEIEISPSPKKSFITSTTGRWSHYCILLKNRQFPASFSLFSSFQCSWQFTMFNINFCQWLNSNCGPLELEAAALPTEPQPLPKLLYTVIFIEREPLVKVFLNIFLVEKTSPRSEEGKFGLILRLFPF